MVALVKPGMQRGGDKVLLPLMVAGVAPHSLACRSSVQGQATLISQAVDREGGGGAFGGGVERCRLALAQRHSHRLRPRLSQAQGSHFILQNSAVPAAT